MTETCARHPEAPAVYGCEGCGRHLCSECIEESDVLLLCGLCGERAMPLEAEQPATAQELARAREVPYTLGKAVLVRGFFAAGADAVKITNLVFGLGVVVVLVVIVTRRLFEGVVPIVGELLSSLAGIYWAFLTAHLAGLLFRRHIETMDRLYWPRGGLS